MKAFLFVFLFSLCALGQTYKPNMIINGDMSIDQRASATAAITIGAGVTYFVDRFAATEDFPTGVGVMTQFTIPSTLPPFLSGLKYAGRITATTGFTAPGAGNVAYLEQKIEGNDFVSISQKQATLSFWAKLNRTSTDYPFTACIGFRNSAQDRVLISQITYSANNTWQEFAIPVDLKTGTSAGTWVYNTGIGLRVTWLIGSGSTYLDGVNNTWVSTVEVGTSACAKSLLNTTNDTFELTGVRLTEGTQKLPFIRAGGGTQAAELALAQRYYEKSYSYTVPVGTATDIGTYMIRVGANSTNPIAAFVKFATSKRLADVTISIFDLLGNSNKVQAYDSSSDPANVGSPALLTTNDGFRIYSGITIPAHGFSFHWVASSEL